MPLAECWTCSKQITLASMPYCKECKARQAKGTLEEYM